MMGVHEDDEREYGEHDEDETDDVPEILGDLNRRADCRRHGGARRGQNTDEDYERSAVADAVFGDSLAQPHDHDRTAHEHDYDEGHSEVRGGGGLFEGEEGVDGFFPADDDAYCLHRREDEREITGNLGYFASAHIALFGEFLQLGDDEREQLHNDKRIDERQDTEREEGRLRERTARDHRQYAEESVALVHDFLHGGGAESGHGDEAPHPVNQNEKEGEEHLHPYLFGFECVFQCLKHYSTSVLPPAFSIFATAAAENFLARTVTFFSSVPSPRTLSP